MRRFPPGRTLDSAVTFGLLLACLSLPIPTAAQDAAAADRPARACTVERIVDGDTFVCEDGERVRLLLVNTPETHQRPYGRLATELLEEMIPPGVGEPTSTGTAAQLASSAEPRTASSAASSPARGRAEDKTTRRGDQLFIRT